MAACENNEACFTTSHLMTGWRPDRWNVGAFQFPSDRLMAFIIFMFDQTFPRWLVAVSPVKPRRHPRAANNVAFAVLRSRVLRVCVRRCRFSDAVRLTVLSKVSCKACSTSSLLLSSFISLPISLAGWLLTTGLYPDNLWMTTFTCTAMLDRQLQILATLQLIPKQPNRARTLWPWRAPQAAIPIS